MVRCISKFISACYVARRNVISAAALDRFREFVVQFHELRNIFVTSGVRKSISLPRQHALVHYFMSIQLFGSPNGLCSSITESKHKEEVKDPWRRSSRYKALYQILLILVRSEKMAALRRLFVHLSMLKGTTASYMAGSKPEDTPEDPTPLASELAADEDGAPVDGVSEEETLSIVTLSARTGACGDRLDMPISQVLIQKLHTRNLCMISLIPFKSPIFPLPFANSFPPSTTLLPFPVTPTSSPTCLSFMVGYAFTILPLRHSLRQAISVVQEGCVKRGSAPSLPGMKIHAAIQFSLSWMIAFLVWKVWL